MTFDEIIQTLETDDNVPEAAMIAAGGHLPALAPLVVGLIEKVRAGVHLMPRQRNLLVYGIHILAAGGETSAYRPFVDVLKVYHHDLAVAFGGSQSMPLNGLLIGLYDGDADPLYEFISDTDNHGSLTWAVFQALAWLTWQERTPRERFVAFLTDYPDLTAEAYVSEGHWLGWLEAISVLGLEELRQAALDTWTTADDGPGEERERQGWINKFSAGASAAKFAEAEIGPIGNPVTALSGKFDPVSLEQRNPGSETSLTKGEIEWLSNLLCSEYAPFSSMNIDQLDGFLCAIALNAKPTPPSKWLSYIWDTKGKESFEFDSDEQAEFTLDLLMRHWNTIVGLLGDELLYRPIVTESGGAAGVFWARGFLKGMGLQSEEWRRDRTETAVNFILGNIEKLGSAEHDPDPDNDTDPEVDGTDDALREELIMSIPNMLFALSLYRRSDLPMKHRTKVGRNDPCPCGSGRKYKACCINGAVQAMG